MSNPVTPRKTKKTFAECYQQAARELKMPARGPIGSKANKLRQWMGATIHRRAVELWKAQ